MIGRWSATGVLALSLVLVPSFADEVEAKSWRQRARSKAKKYYRKVQPTVNRARRYYNTTAKPAARKAYNAGKKVIRPGVQAVSPTLRRTYNAGKAGATWYKRKVIDPVERRNPVSITNIYKRYKKYRNKPR